MTVQCEITLKPRLTFSEIGGLKTIGAPVNLTLNITATDIVDIEPLKSVRCDITTSDSVVKGYRVVSLDFNGESDEELKSNAENQLAEKLVEEYPSS